VRYPADAKYLTQVVWRNNERSASETSPATTCHSNCISQIMTKPALRAIGEKNSDRAALYVARTRVNLSCLARIEQLRESTLRSHAQ